jgi:hypothetical protein
VVPFPLYVAAGMAIAAGTMAATWRAGQRLSVAGAVLVGGATGLFLLHGLGYFHPSVPLDDAFITFRYSRHFADGLGPNWNSSGRVEGYTSFSWMALLAGFARIGADPVVTSQVLGALATVATFAIVVGLWRLWAQHDASIANLLVIAAVVLAIALTDGVGYWGFSGMETPLFTALLTGGAFLYLRERRAGGVPWSAACLAATSMTRPEGLIVSVVTGVFVLYDAWDASDRRRALTRAALWGVTFAALFGPYFLWRYSYYGYLFPNTYYAKVGATRTLYDRGLHYLIASGLKYQLLMMCGGVALLAASSARLRRDALYVMASTSAMLVGVVFEGGDYFGHGRFVVPLLPLLYLSGVAGYANVLSSAALDPARMRAAVALVLTLAALSLVAASGAEQNALQRQFERENAVLGSWLNEHAPQDSLIASMAVGELGYYANDRDVLDLLGINDVVIAHSRVPALGAAHPGHERYNIDYVLERARPTIIIASAGSPVPLQRSDVEALGGAWGALIPGFKALLTDPRLWQDYTLRWLLLDGHWATLLVRTDAVHALQGPGLTDAPPSVQ